MKSTITLALSCTLLAAMAATSQAGITDFSNPDLSDWTPDRYAPAVFETSMFDGDSRLRQGVRSIDNQANRVGGFASGFYNYQGMQVDVGAAPGSSVAIDIFVDSTWDSGTRAGMWTTMSNGNNTFPIIEYVVNGDNGDGNGATYTGFRYWQSGVGWTETSFDMPATDAWYTLSITLLDSVVEFAINDTNIATVNNQGAEMIENVILNVHNQGLAGDYDVYWDNFNVSVVPLPPAAFAGLIMLGGFAGVRTIRRRK